VTVALGHDSVELRVRDTGIGIAPAMLESIFDLFRQAGRSPDRAQSGLGIGLTHLHGGTIEAHSEGKDRGAEFIVRLPPLPADDRKGRSAQQGARTYTRRDRLRVLVVDDNADIADTLAELLRDVLGHEVRVAYEGRSAIAMAAEFRPRVILLDIGLPGMDGYELAKTLRAAGSDALLVAVTGYGQAADRRRAVEAGFMAHLVKPVQIDALMGVLEAADPVRQPQPSDGGASSPACRYN
jgi:CheY-like chemotaxis protein